jgi:SPOR domain
MTDIFQSPGDRLRFEILLKSLTEGSINLAVLSEHDMVLDYYGNLFDERLRAKGNHQVEFCFSTNSERLVQKFNEILSELTLNQALEKDKKHAPRRFLIFRDSILMQDFELQLLARLVNGFPAGNINVILLINSAADFRSKLAAFGKNLLEWEVETQAGEAKKPLTDWVADSLDAGVSQIEPTLTPFPVAPVSPSAESTELLKQPTKTSWRVPEFGKPTEASPVLGPMAEAPVVEVSREPALQISEALTPPKVAEPEVFKRPRKSPWGWMVLVFLLSLAAFGMMYQELVMQEVDAFKKYLLRGTPAAVASEQDAAVAAAAASAAEAASAAALAEAQAAASAAASAAVEPASQPASQVASAAAVVASTPALVPASALAPAVVASSVATAPVVEPPKVADIPKTKPVEKAPAKAAESNTEDAWLEQLPTDGFVVQLAAFDTQADAAAFQRSNAVYAKARIVRAPKKGTNQRYFILLSRPFANKAQADAFMQSSPLLAKGWLRSVKSLKTQFNKP